MTRCSQFAVALAATLMLNAPLSQAKPVRASSDPVKDEPPITDEDREHWSFRRLLRPEVPTVKHAELARGEIDKFILARLEAEGLSLSKPAKPSTLLRRVTLDLVGLPPSEEEVQTFLRDCGGDTNVNDQAYEAVVNRLLASDRYGEAMAQQWLDLARFAETDGFEHDKDRPLAWQYRDWLIKALNEDKPFDDFIAAQIAGDELNGKDAIATAFLLAGPDMPDTNFQDERLHLLLNDITATVGSGFLGITIGCAQCHDHPYDPISQADFYRLRACFDNIPRPKKDQQMGHMMKEAGREVPVSKICIRGDHQRPGPTIKAAFPRIANPAGLDVFAAELPNSTGRRAAFARWLTQPTNGLFLRSSMNRLWQQHFHHGIASTSNDLGTQGDKPTHPELLDWLATELPMQKWSLKTMHKLIVMSSTYRQSAAMRDTSAQSFGTFLVHDKDPENHLLSHFPSHRLTGEQLRDAMLFVSGRINLKMGGESVRLPLPAEVAETLLDKQRQVTKDTAEHDRRSIYVFARRNVRLPMFDVFDRPDALLSCSRRNESVTAPQALTLLNSSFSSSMAQSLAQAVMSKGSDAVSIVTEGVRRCFSREPAEADIKMGGAFLEKQTALTQTLDEAVADYCLALLNASEFCFVD